MVALLHSNRSKATMLSSPPRRRSDGASYLPRDGPLTRAPVTRAGTACTVARAARCAVHASIPRLATATTAVPISDDWLSQRVCRTTATTNAPTNRRICRRPGS